MLFVLGFFAIFVIGGLTGVMLASVPLDLQVHDTFFVVAHLHYVLIGGAVFPLFGAFYYWFPKLTGRMLSERLGQVELLAAVHRLQPDLLPDAHARPARHAAAGLHLSAEHGLGRPEPAGHRRRRVDGAPGVALFLFDAVRSLRSSVVAPDNPLGRQHARMGHGTSPAAVRATSLCRSRSPDATRCSRTLRISPSSSDCGTTRATILVTHILDARARGPSRASCTQSDDDGLIRRVLPQRVASSDR